MSDINTNTNINTHTSSATTTTAAATAATTTTAAATATTATAAAATTTTTWLVDFSNYSQAPGTSTYAPLDTITNLYLYVFLQSRPRHKKHLIVGVNSKFDEGQGKKRVMLGKWEPGKVSPNQLLKGRSETTETGYFLGNASPIREHTLLSLRVDPIFLLEARGTQGGPGGLKGKPGGLQGALGAPSLAFPWVPLALPGCPWPPKKKQKIVFFLCPPGPTAIRRWAQSRTANDPSIVI